MSKIMRDGSSNKRTTNWRNRERILSRLLDMMNSLLALSLCHESEETWKMMKIIPNLSANDPDEARHRRMTGFE